MQTARSDSGRDFWLPVGVGSTKDSEPERRGGWTALEDDMLWELVETHRRNWVVVAAALTDNLRERNLPEPQHLVNGDACRGRYDLLQKKQCDDNSDEPAGIPQPSGRPPKDKVWDSIHGEWVDDPALQDDTARTCPTCKKGKGICSKKNQPGHLSGPLDAFASAGTAAAGRSAGTHTRPQGRAPKGKVWDDVRGKWIVDTARAVQRTISKKPPQKQKPFGGRQSTRNNVIDGAACQLTQLDAKLKAAQTEFHTKRKRFDEDKAALDQRYAEETAALGRCWSKDKAEAEREIKKLRDLKREAEDALQGLADKIASRLQ